MNRLVAAALALAGSLALPLAASAQQPVETRPPNGATQKPAFAGQTRVPEQKTDVAFEVVTVAQGLQNPWSLAFLPDGRMLVTEKPGHLRVMTPDGKMSEPVAGLPPVDSRGQGGLLDVSLHPDFATNRLIYWSFSEPAGPDGVAGARGGSAPAPPNAVPPPATPPQGALQRGPGGQSGPANNTAVARGRFVDDPAAPRVENVEVIYHQSPSLQSTAHFGSRLVWGRDGTLFITQGDRSVTEGRMQAQKMDSLLGKIVRINADGSIPNDNPFVGKPGVRPEIWSFGHRNVQAATLHPTTGELWEVEHGTRGGDELNVAKKGRDYGWPTIAYGIEYRGAPITGGIQQQEGMEQPVYYWDPVIAPSGMTFYSGKLFPAWKGSLFIGGLGSTHLVRLSVEGERVVGEERLLTDLQPQRERIRDVVEGPDGALYLLTNSQNSRLLKLVPRQ
jgi:glucose/arabinose dehydrogenase